MRLIAFLFVNLFLSAAGLAQIQPENPLRFERFTIDQGLASDRVYSITQDLRGYIWLATDGGVSRYNGYGFSNYRNYPNDPSSLTDNFVHVVYTDSKGDVWVGTRYGLNRYKAASDNFERYYHSPGDPNTLPHSSVHSIYESASGRLWMGTENGLAEYDRETGRFISKWEVNGVSVSLSGSMVTTIAGDEDGRLWIGTNNRGLVAYQPRDNTLRFMNEDPSIRIPFPSVNISRIMVDSNGELWIGFLQDSGFRASLEVLLQYGLARFNPQTMEFKLYSHDPENGIEEVGDDLFWLGLDGPGIIKWNRGNYAIEHIAGGSPIVLSGSIHVIRKDPDGYIWLGNSGQGLIRHDPATGNNEYYQYTENEAGSIAGNYITDIRIARDSTVWVATSNGLSRYNRHNNTFTNFRQETHSAWMTGNALSSLLEDRHGNIWIGTNRHVYDPAARNATGLIKWNPVTNQYRTFRHDASKPGTLSNDAIYAVAEDSHGDIWVATNNGLNRYLESEDRFEVYLESDGLPSPVIIGVLFDDDGYLWMSTMNGLARLDPENGAIRVFSKADNVQANRFNENSFFKNSRGELMFGGVAGLNYFDPSVISGTDVIPEMLITGVTVNDETARFAKSPDETESITLGWTENSVGFEYTAINFRSAGLTQYEYMLQGFNADWIRAGTRRFTNYTNLKPGTYRFMVRAQNAHAKLDQDLDSGNSGKPMVTVTTRYLGDSIVISVSDNGPGIPESIKDKIFQPFFTTKPTGQGTGVGLSLSYDIVKAHGGNLDIQSRPGETIFTITLKGDSSSAFS